MQNTPTFKKSRHILSSKEKSALAALLLGTLLLFIYTAVFIQHITLQYALPINVLLAAMHFPFALLYLWWVNNKKTKLPAIIFLLFWLAAFPNAPYMLTDFIHIATYSYPYGAAELPNLSPWIAYFQILASITLGVLYGYLSLYLLQKSITRQYNKTKGWLFSFTASFLAAVGIYIGRFMRFHSIDILRKPLSLVKEFAGRLHLKTLLFLFGIFAVTFSGYLLFYLFFSDRPL